MRWAPSGRGGSAFLTARRSRCARVDGIGSTTCRARAASRCSASAIVATRRCIERSARSLDMQRPDRGPFQPHARRRERPSCHLASWHVTSWRRGAGRNSARRRVGGLLRLPAVLPLDANRLLDRIPEGGRGVAGALCTLERCSDAAVEAGFDLVVVGVAVEIRLLQERRWVAPQLPRQREERLQRDVACADLDVGDGSLPPMRSPSSR